jgi:diguanylate cyclase (GGDEF)-like protein
MDEIRRFGAALVRAGQAAWSRSFGRGAHAFEQALLGFMSDMAGSTNPDAIEAALVRLARRIAPAGRIERIPARGEWAECDGGADALASTGDAGRDEPNFVECPVRCGAADHGFFRAYLSGSSARRAARTTMQQRFDMACTLAACALESARRHAEWGYGHMEDGEPSERLQGDADAKARAPQQRRGVVRDATFLNAVLPFALEQSRRHGEPVSLVCVKLDRLGAIRDLLGSPLADRLVHELGEIVGSLVRASDLVARLDDDRIVALLVRARGEGAMKVARSIGRAVADAGLGSPRLPGTSVSIGVAEFPAVARDAASLLDAADEAMSMARVSGSDSPILARPRSAPREAHIHVHAPSTVESPAMSSCSF